MRRLVSLTTLGLALACTSSGQAAPPYSGPRPSPRVKYGGPAPGAPVTPRPAATTPPVAAPPPSTLPAPVASTTPAIPGATEPEPGGRRAPARLRPDRSPLGTNLTMIKPWSGEWVFKDVFHQAMPWRSESTQGVPDPRPLSYDASGWITKLEPGQRATVRFFNAEEKLTFPSGTYTVSWEGRGRFEFERVRVVEQRANAATLQVDGNAGIFGMALVATSPADPVRNVQVLMPGGSCASDEHQWCESAAQCGGGPCVPFASTVRSQPYHPTFLRSLEPYSTLRFMMWNETIGSRVTKWSDRVTPTTGLYAAFGAPYEVMIQLCNHLRTDLWLTVPLHADDDFVEKLATLVKSTLAPELKVYVEYSNEVWNGAFPMAAELRAQGLEAKLSTNPFQAQMRRYAQRTGQIWSLWSKVFAGDPRLIRVLAAQNDGPGVAREALSFERIAEQVDALAIAPYFGAGAGTPAASSRIQGLTPDQLVDAVETQLLPGAIEGIRIHAALAAEIGKKRGRPLELIAYEGGQHLVGVGTVQDDAEVRALFRAANKTPKMGALYRKYLAAWKANGGHLFVHFVHTNLPSRWGSFGLIERPGQSREEAPKLDAVLDFIEQNPRWW